MVGQTAIQNHLKTRGYQPGTAPRLRAQTHHATSNAFSPPSIQPPLQFQNINQVPCEFGWTKNTKPLKLGNAPEISWHYLEKIIHTLKPGDLMIFYSDGTESFVDWFDVNIMRATLNPKFYNINYEQYPEPYKCAHTAVYLGGGKIAECTAHPAAIRVIDMHDKNFGLRRMGARYMIFRPKDPKFGMEVAQASYKFATPFRVNGEINPSPGKYDYPAVTNSLLSSSKLNYDGIKRAMEAVIYGQILNNHEAAFAGQNTYRDFFCSYFTAWSYQAVEGKYVLDNLRIPIPPREYFSTNGRIDHLKVDHFAKELAKNPAVQNGMSQTVFNINQRNATPVQLLDRVLNTKHFHHIFTLTPDPNAPSVLKK